MKEKNTEKSIPQTEEFTKEEETSNTLEEPKHSKHPLLKKIGIFIILLLILIYCYSSIWIHKIIIIKEYPVIAENLPFSYNGFKIVQFSDIHYGKTINEPELKKIIEQINLTNADIVIFNGDLFDNGINLPQTSIEIIKENLKNIHAKLKKIAIRGDNDYHDIKTYQEIMNFAGFQLLENESTLIFNENEIPIQIAGISSEQIKEYDLKKCFETNEPNIGYKILIAHEPDIINHIENYEIDLILAGHSLGGLINIPLINQLFKKTSTDQYQNGFYQVNNTKLYVSSGLGTEEINIRFNNPPSINLYRFYNYPE